MNIDLGRARLLLRRTSYSWLARPACQTRPLLHEWGVTHEFSVTPRFSEVIGCNAATGNCLNGFQLCGVHGTWPKLQFMSPA